MDPFIGEIRIFGFNFPPEDWAYCNGQQLSASQNPALYSIIGGVYGSSGSQAATLFNLPNLQSQAVMGASASSPDYLNQSSGAEKVQLTLAQLPAHTHAIGGETIGGAANYANTPGPTVLPNLIFVGNTAQRAYTSGTPNTSFSPQAISAVGGGGTHENRQPFLAFNFCICVNGIYPSFE